MGVQVLVAASSWLVLRPFGRGGNLGRSSAAARAMVLLLLGILSITTTTTTNRSSILVAAQNQNLFSSNVVTLTSSNWKEHVVDNPHLVFVNICRKG